MKDPVQRVFPLGFPWETQDPFLFCVYHLDAYPKGNEHMGPDASLEGRNLGNDFIKKDGWRMYHGRRIPGFPYHPHRGFETITIVNKGFCDHSDSLGAAGRFGQGDVQWMTAGHGVQHSEMFPLLHREQENTLELFQIWLNLPRAKKRVAPHFKMLWHEEIPVVATEGVRIKVISGVYKDTQGPDPAPDSWAAEPGNEVAIWTLRMDAGSRLNLPPASETTRRSLYYHTGGGIQLAGKAYGEGHGFDLAPEQEVLIENGSEISALLFLQGKPIGEPVAKYGPFVMNTEEEIRQAMKEYGSTQFGGWPWPEAEMVHPREVGRFARYPDGTRVEKPLFSKEI